MLSNIFKYSTTENECLIALSNALKNLKTFIDSELFKNTVLSIQSSF